MNFNRFELIVKNFFGYIEVLRITSNDDQSYSNAEQWEKLILSSMPNSRIFDINHSERNISLTYQYLIDRFDSPFWISKQWFFTYQHTRQENMNGGIFYSTNPYR